MTDVLGYLNELVHRVSATFIPTEMEDVASFLRGDAWVTVTARSNAAGESAPTAHASTLLRYPLGATQWGHFIPLGIAGSALVSAATSGSRAVLLNFFESSGFAQVFTVDLAPTEHQQQQQQQLGVSSSHSSSASLPSLFGRKASGSAGAPLRKRQRALGPAAAASPAAYASSAQLIDIALDGRQGATAQAARHACVSAVRSWFEGLEESLAEEHEAYTSSTQETAQAVPHSSEQGGPLFAANPASAAATRPPRKTQLRRLLILVRCCADNRAVVSTRGGSTHAAAHTASAATSGSSSRRHRKNDDPLLLFLHDLAALSTLYEARLASTTCSVRPAVLLLPEDESYGGAMLRQRLTEEVGYRYWVELFLQADQQRQHQPHGDKSGSAASARSRMGMNESWKASLAGRGATHRNGLPPQLQQQRQGEVPLVRGCRLAAFWGVLDAAALTPRLEETCAQEHQQQQLSTAPSPSASSSSSPSSLPSTGARAAVQNDFASASTEQLEMALRRHPACFFVRPSNAPLCVFLSEALRRFPLLAPPAMLRHWQATWTARHSLNDILFMFHTAVCPFTVSAANSEPSVRAKTNATPASALLQDATDLMDALLDASFTLAEERDTVQPLSSNDFRIEQATLFMLLYEALVYQREGRLRRVPSLVDVLLRLYERHAATSDVSCPLTAARVTSTEEKVRFAVRHLLPFAPLNTFYMAVQQRDAAATQSGPVKREVRAYPMNTLVLPLRCMSVAPQLQSTTLLSLLPPEASLLELRGVAERVWEAQMPDSWRRIVEGTRKGLRTSPSSLGDIEAPATADDSQPSGISAVPLELSAENFFHPLVPHAVRVLYLLTAHAMHAPTEAAKQVPVVQLQAVCQLSDEQLLLVLKELQVAGLVSANLKTQTARTLLDSV